MFHNTSASNVTTYFVLTPQKAAEEKKKKLMQNQGSVAASSVWKAVLSRITLKSWRWFQWGRVAVYLQSFTVLQRRTCGNLFIRLYLRYSSYLTACMLSFLHEIFRGLSCNQLYSQTKWWILLSLQPYIPGERVIPDLLRKDIHLLMLIGDRWNYLKFKFFSSIKLICDTTTVSLMQEVGIDLFNDNKVHCFWWHVN